MRADLNLDSRFLPAIGRAGLCGTFAFMIPGTPLHRSCYRPGRAWHMLVISSGTGLSRSLWTFTGTSSQARTLHGLIGSTRGEVSNKMQSPAQLDKVDEQDASLEINNGGPGQSRTADLRFRKPLLYPSELRGRCEFAPLSHVVLST